MDTECLLPNILADQQLETDVSASNNRFWYLAPTKTEGQLLWCLHRWSHEASNTRVAIYHKTAPRPGDQQKQQSAPPTVCAHVMMWLWPSVVPHPFGPVLSILIPIVWVDRSRLACNTGNFATVDDFCQFSPVLFYERFFVYSGKRLLKSLPALVLYCLFHPFQKDDAKTFASISDFQLSTCALAFINSGTLSSSKGASILVLGKRGNALTAWCLMSALWTVFKSKYDFHRRHLISSSVTSVMINSHWSA